jgi:hypothetical protein
MYYLRTRPAADAIKFTVDQQLLNAYKMKHDEPVAAGSANTSLEIEHEEEEPFVCRKEEGCWSCGS